MRSLHPQEEVTVKTLDLGDKFPFPGRSQFQMATKQPVVSQGISTLEKGGHPEGKVNCSYFRIKKRENACSSLHEMM